ncbi:MAG: hypothetical protein JSW07_00360 [bacterium]|nr:MAG: hypothetical protein JSW07_00360 [bacterium]
MKLEIKKKLLSIYCILLCSVWIFDQAFLTDQQDYTTQKELSNQAYSQQPLRFQYIGEKEGLEQRSINTILQNRPRIPVVMHQ